MEDAIAKILFWAVGVLATLLTIETIIIIWHRRALGFEIKLWWKKPKGYGIMEIINNDGTREHRIEKLTDEEIRIEGKESGEYERYITERRLYTYRLRDRVSMGTWYRNLPYMMNLTGRRRTITITEPQTIELPEPFRQEDVEKANVFDSIILKHKQLSGDFFSKYWKIIILVILVVGLITLVGFWLLHSKQTAILDGCIAQTDMIKSICSQKVVV